MTRKFVAETFRHRAANEAYRVTPAGRKARREAQARYRRRLTGATSLDEPGELAILIRSGAVWRLPQFWQQAFNAIADGLVPLAECMNLPPELHDGFTR
jgi:hypothetical protein